MSKLYCLERELDERSEEYTEISRKNASTVRLSDILAGDLSESQMIDQLTRKTPKRYSFYGRLPEKSESYKIN